MPIKGLTDRPGPGFPIIGSLRKGAPRPTDGKRPGLDLNHFRFVASVDNEELEADFREKYGPKPSSIEVIFLGKNVDDNFTAWQEEWSASKMIHRCDGENVVLLYDNKTQRYKRDPGIKCDGAKCKPSGRLNVWLPRLERAGLVTVVTSSIHDIGALHSNLSAAMQLQGDLRGIPFMLYRNPRKISVPDGKGGRVRMEKFLLGLEIEPGWFARKLTEVQTIALPNGGVPDVPLLASPRMPDSYELGDSEGEYNIDEVTGEIIEGEVEEVAAPQREKPPPPQRKIPEPSVRMKKLLARYNVLAQEAREINRQAGAEVIKSEEGVATSEGELIGWGKTLKGRIEAYRVALKEVAQLKTDQRKRHSSLYLRCQELAIETVPVKINEIKTEELKALCDSMEEQIEAEEAKRVEQSF